MTDSKYVIGYDLSDPDGRDASAITWIRRDEAAKVVGTVTTFDHEFAAELMTRWDLYPLLREAAIALVGSAPDGPIDAAWLRRLIELAPKAAEHITMPLGEKS